MNNKVLRFDRFLVSIFLLLFGVTCVVAQPDNRKFTVSGTTVDSKTNEPLVGVSVKVTSSDGGTGTFCISDNDGKFSFEVSRSGRYTLELTYVGYKKLQKDVDIWPFEPRLGKFKMKEDPKMLAEVEAVGYNQRIKQMGDTRNIHFYVNRLGFHIIEFFNAHHRDPHLADEQNTDPTGGEGMFRFEKIIQPTTSFAVHCDPKG